jgi:hypothetical protein
MDHVQAIRVHRVSLLVKRSVGTLAPLRNVLVDASLAGMDDEGRQGRGQQLPI